MTSPFDENAGDFSYLTGSEKKKLRGLAQLLQPRVHVGKQGVTPEILKEFEVAFKKRLVKVRFVADRGAIMKLSDEIATQTASFLVCNVGKTSVFFRQRKEEPAAAPVAPVPPAGKTRR